MLLCFSGWAVVWFVWWFCLFCDVLIVDCFLVVFWCWWFCWRCYGFLGFRIAYCRDLWVVRFRVSCGWILVLFSGGLAFGWVVGMWYFDCGCV